MGFFIVGVVLGVLIGIIGALNRVKLNNEGYWECSQEELDAEQSKINAEQQVKILREIENDLQRRANWQDRRCLHSMQVDINNNLNRLIQLCESPQEFKSAIKIFNKIRIYSGNNLR